MPVQNSRKQTTVRVAPEAREDHDKHAVLDLEHFLPYRLSVLSNRISQDIAALYEERFGIGITEWRIIAVLGRFPGLSANEVAERTAMDKVAVSRAVRTLVDKALLHQAFNDQDRRRSELGLSKKGFRIFDEIVPLALAYERDLLADLTPAEQQQLMGLLERISASERALGQN